MSISSPPPPSSHRACCSQRARSLPPSSVSLSRSSPVYSTTILASMATVTTVQKADSPTLKRALTTSNTPFPSKKFEHTFTHQSCYPTSASHSPHCWSSRSGNRSPRSGQPSRTSRPSMVHTSQRTFVPMPSFGSVFGEEVTKPGFQEPSGLNHTSAHGTNVARPASSGNLTTTSSTGVPFSSFHIHRDSRDSTSTASSDNSPTTTISTMDSSSVTDPSPGPSPESPIAKAAPSSFVADFRSRRTEGNSADSSPNTFFELQRPTTPAKKARNLKNLGINTATSLTNLRANPTAPMLVVTGREKNSSAPPSPSFIKPPTPPKRRPSNLSLTISPPGSNENKPARLIIPSTPSLNRPALRHFQSSPSLPLCSPSVPPTGGMQLPILRPIKTTNASGLSEVPFEMEEEEDQEPNFDIPQSREEKPAAYPNGPICIYPAGVYLYFEPTAEQAATFDVIVNVASEVKNPFTAAAQESQKDLNARRVDGPPAENVDFASLAQQREQKSTTPFDTQGSSPTTPKATPVLETVQPSEQVINGKTYKTPEYIHMPWEHNTDIVPDLYKLVKIMDDRVQQGKRVLVHCQCGVSRSASLIVAYGLYKDPEMSVQQAYDRVKKRSKWIGPNMNLIMQLQEFRNGLLRANENRSYHNQVFGRRSAGLPTARSTGTNRYSPFERESSSGARTPRTAPLPPDVDMNMQRASTGNMISLSPGPLSAPTGAFSPCFRRSWDSSQTFNLSSTSSPTPTPYVDPKGHVVPVLSITNNDLPPAQQLAAYNAEVAQTEQEFDSKPLAVPNFSRQLPLRTLENQSDVTSPNTEEFHTAPMEPLGFDALKSPAVASFTIPPVLAANSTDDSEIMSPIKTEFDMNAWPSAQNLESEPSPRTMDPSAPELPISPRSTEFHMTALNYGEYDGSYGMLSPRATSFDLSHSPDHQTSWPSDRSSQNLDIMSPTTSQFPKNVFGRNSLDEDDTLSPRAIEFHMTPLKPRVADEDPFGLTSPRNFETSRNSFFEPELPVPQEPEDELRRPSFQAILPPSTLAQPEAVNGFTSLNSTAQVQPSILAPVTLPNLTMKNDFYSDERVDSLQTSSEDQPIPSVESTQDFPRTPEKSPFRTPFKQTAMWTPESSLLSTPPKQPAIRTRFSSPNMREQRKLHKLQTEMEAMLPHKAPRPQQAADDLDALMSPRAEEFTRNPFHFDLRSPGNDPSPASSEETIKEGPSQYDWKDTRQWTPEKATDDPRSPVQTGSSPIVRNIWDVL